MNLFAFDSNGEMSVTQEGYIPPLFRALANCLGEISKSFPRQKEAFRRSGRKASRHITLLLFPQSILLPSSLTKPLPLQLDPSSRHNVQQSNESLLCRTPVTSIETNRNAVLHPENRTHVPPPPKTQRSAAHPAHSTPKNPSE
jgi:hypothetical protein